MTTDIQTYLSLRTALLTEKAQIEARLTAINNALHQSGAVVPAAAATTATASPKKRVFSAATKRKMAVAQKARWAAKQSVPTKTVTAPAAAAQPAKRKYSAAAKARMAAGAKARWAKVRAAAKSKAAK